MNVVDPREFSDRELIVDRLFGNLIPRSGWPGRRRAIAFRMLQVALLTVGAIVGLVVGSLVVIFVWAATQGPA